MRLTDLRRFTGKFEDHPTGYGEPIYEEATAADLVAALIEEGGFPLWWCARHTSTQLQAGGRCEYALWKGYDGPPNDCGIAEGIWFPIPEVIDEETE